MNSDRFTSIQQHLYVHGLTNIQDLAKATGASIATIRRDLQRLEDEGIITRTHGGALLARTPGPEVAFQARENEHLDAKRAIAGAAYSLLRPYTTVFLDAGTTVLQLARRLRLEPLPVTVFTNGLAVAQELINLPEVRVNLLGGQLRSENLSVVGPYAERLLDEFWFDQLFLGTSAIRDAARMYTLDPAEASLNRHMLTRCAQAIVLADASKFGASAPYSVAPVTAAHTLITDARIDSAWKKQLAELGVAAQIVPLNRGTT